MSWLTNGAIYFIVWWITLFAVLPFGVRTQDDERQIVPGTVASAPAKFRFFRVMAVTTVVSAVIVVGWNLGSTYFGVSFADLPHIMPDIR
jgi:predicted secreted protein